MPTDPTREESHMQTIWKYPLAVDDSQSLDLPQGAVLLTVVAQGGTPCLWALVDPIRPTEPRRFLTYGTGHPYEPMGQTYLGSYQLSGGALVFHVFEAP